ncbi:MAG: ATP-dependent zinc metalloprotease FtsH [Simkaniaceae bacterium]|nr:ATP-dependent zinc metalloprotease FtsH [Simkaniaceae bacterium]
MNFEKKNNEKKKGFPGGFFLLLLAAIFLILTLQNLGGSKTGSVSFSHQLEHLVNLDLIHKDQSKKYALGDNLVTFSGKFQDNLSDQAKARYRYLELLNQSHTLSEEKKTLASNLSTLQKDVRVSADWFFHLSGAKMPRGGFTVVGQRYNTPERQNSVIIDRLSDKKTLSLKDVEMRYMEVSTHPTAERVEQLGTDLAALYSAFQSPSLGVGSEPIKKILRDGTQKIEETNSSAITTQEKLAVYHTEIENLQRVVAEIGAPQEHVRLMALRSVRTYVETLDQYETISASLSTNSAELEKARATVADAIWFFNNQEISTKALERQTPEAFSQWFVGAKEEWENFAQNQGLAFSAPHQPRNAVLEKTFKSEEPAPNYMSYLFTLLPVILLLVVLYFVFSRQMKGVGSNAMNFGKSPARLLSKSGDQVTFKNVAGVDEAKEELEEIVDFLKDPAKFTALGARIPRGVLCVGPPGTGKTLIAKAVAGEADRPFFSISGSDFVEMFVGVGASRIRDLFDQAKKSAPCIIFIDEIDAVGRHRGAGIGGGHDEREQTLNQLLVEMDGMNTNEGIILMAATNRPDVLDKALLRPGRFDRRVVLDLPDIKGRFMILKVHARKIKLDSSVDLMLVARQTPGASGADLMNILNESALIAARKGRSAVTAEDTLEATDKVRFGKERRSLEMDEEEKKTTAYHEAGHAIVGLVVKRSDPVEKVTIIPRGFSLGATHFVPKKNRLSYWKKELTDQLAVLMGGRVAEELFIDDMSSGAQMDITQATRLARSMVCEWGMTDKLGTVAYDSRQEEGNYLMQAGAERNYSDETARIIDDEVKGLIDAGYAESKRILEENRDKVILMSEMLIEFETLDREDIDHIMAGTWSADEKRERLQKAHDAHTKKPPPPPIEHTPRPTKPISSEDQAPQQV